MPDKLSDAELVKRLREYVEGGVDWVKGRSQEDLMYLVGGAITRLSRPPEPMSEEFLANIYVQSWDQHIGRDGAIAILNTLQASREAPAPVTDAAIEDQRRQELKCAFVAGCCAVLTWTKSGMPQDDIDEAGYDYAASIMHPRLQPASENDGGGE